MAEGIKAVADNTSRIAGGVVLNHSLSDILFGNVPKVETRTGEQIIDYMKDKLDELGKEDN